MRWHSTLSCWICFTIRIFVYRLTWFLATTMNFCYHIKYSDIEIDESKSFKEHNSNDLILEIKNSTHINIYHVIQFTAYYYSNALKHGKYFAQSQHIRILYTTKYSPFFQWGENRRFNLRNDVLIYMKARHFACKC